MRKIEEYLEQWFQRKPTRAEIAAFLKYSEEDVEKIMQMGNLGIELETEEDSSLSDEQDEDKEAELPERATAFKQAFASLTVKEKMAIRMKAHSAVLEDIAKVLGVSRATADRLVDTTEKKLKESIELK